MGLKAVAEQLLLDGDGLIHIHLHPLIDGALAVAHGNGGVAGDGGGQLLGGGHQLIGGVDVIHQTDAIGFLRLDVAGAVDHFLGLAGTDDPSQTLGAAEAGGDAEAGLGLTEYGILAADADIAAHADLTAAAQRKAVDRCDNGNGEGLNLAENVVALFPEGFALGLGQAAHFPDIRTGHEALFTGAGQDQAADAFQIHAVQGFVQLIQHGAVQGVQGLGAVDGNNTDLAFRFIGNIFHECTLLLLILAQHRRAAAPRCIGLRVKISHALLR